MKARKIVMEMDSYVPGKSQDEIATEFGLNKEDIIKLGSNENPWGPSPKAIEAIEKEDININRYPESDLRELIEEFANYSGVKPSQVIVGGDGADEIIDVLAKTFIDPEDEFIVPLPSYMYYEYLLKQYGAIPVYARWDMDANKLDVDSIIDSITEKTKMIFLCSPNNPTGTLISKEDICKIAEINEDILIVVDEAYFEYSEVTNKDLIDKYENNNVSPCTLKVNDTFIVDSLDSVPEGFCYSAYQSLYPFIMTLIHGGNDIYHGWMKDKNSCVISCNDGFRPVSFLLEVIS